MNAVRGFLLTMVTVLMWASLPLFMKEVLTVLDPPTLLACRFFVATLVIGWWLQRSGRLPNVAVLKISWRWLLLGIAGLAGNFLLFSKALIYLTPAAAQVLGQLSPFILLFASVIFLKESLGWHQWLGVALLALGIALFFNREWGAFSRAQWLGIVLSIGGSVVWVAYALAQKALQKVLSAQQVLVVFYGGAMLLTLPFADSALFAGMSGYHWGCLAFCCANTPIAYGAFAEALACWEVNKVSATLTLVPLFTIAFTEIAFALWPAQFAAPQLNWIAYLGAGLVVFAALSLVLGKAWLGKRQAQEA